MHTLSTVPLSAPTPERLLEIANVFEDIGLADEKTIEHFRLLREMNDKLMDKEQEYDFKIGIASHGTNAELGRNW